MSSILRYFLGIVTLIAGLLPALAAGDPPGRVGRLSQIQGDVIFRSDRQDPGSPATINWPVSSGAIIDTERRSRAEVWVGSTAYRLDSNSRAEFVTVNDQIVDLLLANGTLAVTIRDRDQADDLQIVTPGGRVRFPGPGRFRIEVWPDRTSLAAQSGSAEILTGERPLTVRPGEMATLDERGLLGIDTAPYGDDFDAWVSAQDNRERSNAARRHVSPYMTGYQDLDAYGDWSSSPDYGTVWYPRAVASDWAPYRDGRWAWVEPWGWTWIDAAPGVRAFPLRTLGADWRALGLGTGQLCGTPRLCAGTGRLGRRSRLEPPYRIRLHPGSRLVPAGTARGHVPAYRTSPTYVRQINVTHVHNHAYIDRALRPEYRPKYAYQGHPHAVTVVPANTLREGKTIDNRNIRPYDKQALEQAPVRPRAPGGDWLAPPRGAERPFPPGQGNAIRNGNRQDRPPSRGNNPPSPHREACQENGLT
ncbi:MAG: hypothetical protein HT580_15450 [Dechloromonas sp.]|nr:MAG: hypothetical protein HT580_15450 [Dechloromonas sp.]